MKLRRSGENHIPFARMIFLLILFAFAFIMFFSQLLRLQISHNEYYTTLAAPKNEKTFIMETTRGEITDRFGQKLVTNVGRYDIRINRSLLPYGGENVYLLNIVRFFEKEGIELSDLSPMEKTYPYKYKEPENDKEKRLLKTFLRASEFTDEELSGEEFFLSLCKRYGFDRNISDIAGENEKRKVAGLRYMLEANDFTVGNPYTVFEDAEIELRSKIAESKTELSGLEECVTNTRYYPEGSLAAHILGRTGAISPDNVEKYLDMGYSLNESVGQYGAELAFEEYLRGVNGRKKVEFDEKGEQILSETVISEPKYGNTVNLTISSGMQKAAEDALEDMIKSLNNSNIRSGIRTRCTGAVVVEDCRTGELYAVANYPSYDQNTYSENIAELLEDTKKPLLNRATNGIYPPGSTFKIATAAAALSHGIIKADDVIYDSGIYKEYDDYQPHCWYYDENGYGHGPQNMEMAIMNSCNYYFFEVGRRLGVDKLRTYAGKLGLGETTGIETGEAQGILAGPEYSSSVGKPWNPGDLIASAIGQSDNSFTPLQLASFFSTVVNGGTRYKTHILKNVTDYKTGAIIYSASPEAVDTVEMTSEHLTTLKRGMKSVVEDGTAASVFVGYKHSVGGKTGTAQKGKNQTDNAVFAGFAPYDDPQIVVSVIIDNGAKSYTASTVAKAVFDYYFEHPEEFR